MTPDDARERLGVDLGADRSTVRRAYLRLLKHHKPDTDPEGFQRLREAYELLERLTPASPGRGPSRAGERAAVAVEGSERTPATPDVSASPGPATPDVSASPGPATPDVSASPGPATPDVSASPAPDAAAPQRIALPLELNAEPPPAGPSPHVRAFVERLDALDPDDLSALRRTLQEAVAACPDDADFVLELADLHTRMGHIDAGVRTLRAGAERGLEACALELLYSHPSALDLETVERLAPRVAPADAARAFVALGRFQRAFELASGALEPAHWTAPEFHWAAAGALDVALELVGAGQHALGRDLGQRALRAGVESGAALDAARYDGVRWATRSELFGLRPALDPDVDQGLAKTLLTGNTFHYRFVREALPRRERAALDKRLAKEAPMLAQAAAPVGYVEDDGYESPRSPWWVWLVVVVVLNLFRSCTHCGSSSPDPDRLILQLEHSRRARERDERSRGGEVPASVGAPVSDAAAERSAREALDTLCATTDAPLCDRARFVVSAFRRGDCAAVLEPTVAYATQGLDGGGVVFGPALPPPIAELVRRCEALDGGPP